MVIAVVPVLVLTQIVFSAAGQGFLGSFAWSAAALGRRGDLHPAQRFRGRGEVGHRRGPPHVGGRERAAQPARGRLADRVRRPPRTGRARLAGDGPHHRRGDPPARGHRGPHRRGGHRVRPVVDRDVPGPDLRTPGEGGGRGAGPDGRARARLGAPDPCSHPALGRRLAPGCPVGAITGARAPGVALRGPAARHGRRRRQDPDRRDRGHPAAGRGGPRHRGARGGGGGGRAHRGAAGAARRRTGGDGQRRQVVRRVPGLALRRGGARRGDHLRARPGRGFDPDAVPGDRQGIARSIRARVARIGGSAVIRSSPGDGAEVELSLPCQPAR